MKVTRMKTTPVAIPMGGYSAVSKIRSGPALMQAVMLEVFTDEGITGIAEVPVVAGATMAADLVMSAKELVIGRNPHEVNQLLKKMYACYNLYHLHMHAANWALNSIERALWDIIGQEVEMPLYKLWGGAFRKEAEVFGVVDVQDDLDAMSRTAALKAEQGYKVLYSKIGFGNVEDDIEIVKAIRRGVPDSSITIRVDPNQCWSAGEAIYAINKMEKYGLDCVEQPVLMYNLDALKTVKEATRVPIAAHESTWTMFDMLRVIKENAADVVTIDTRFDAGYYGARLSAGLAEAAGIPVICHAYHELGVAIAERLQIIAACPAFTMVHQWGEYDNVLDDVIQGERFKTINGKVKVPEASGVGVKLDQKKLAKYNEMYIKEIKEAGFENAMDDPLYQAMYARSYIKEYVKKS